MKSFFKYVLASIVAFILIGLFFFLIGLGIIGTISGSMEQEVVVKNNSVLLLNFNGELQDKNTSENPVSMITSQIMGGGGDKLQLKTVLDGIKAASKDDKIKGIYMNLTDIKGIFGGMGSIKEVRDALIQFKNSNKFVYTYSNFGLSQKAYYIATVSDSIFLNPLSSTSLTGLSSSIPMYKTLLDNLGIKAEVIRVGKFKSAVEPYILNEISPASREQISVYEHSMWSNMVTAMAAGRKLSIDYINDLIDNFKIYTPLELKEKKIIDEVYYEDQMDSFLKAKLGIKEDKKISTIGIEEYASTITPTELYEDKIAVIYAQGQIINSDKDEVIGPKLAKELEKARKDDKIKAIVLRVNSPGGDVITSDIIWREVKLAAAKKPLIASMGDVAASGGYYISCAADTIVAEPTTITGSIGIFGLFFSGEKLIKDKIGIKTSTVSTHKHGAFGGSAPIPFLPILDRTLTKYERNVLQDMVNKGYQTFLSRVSEGRKMDIKKVHEIAQGRVWTGADAKKIGLVDVMGGLYKSIEIAAEKAGLKEYKIVEYPKQKDDIFGKLFSSMSKKIKAKSGISKIYSNLGIAKDVEQLMDNHGIQARIPYDIYVE